MSALSDYKASVKSRDGYFFQSLPSNAPGIGTNAGKVGARFPGYSATKQYRFEVAPVAVQLEAGTISFLESIVHKVTDYAVDNPLGVPTFEEDWKAAKDSYAKGKAFGDSLIPEPVDLVASAFGLNRYVFLGIVGLVAYAVARQAGVVPPLSKVFK